MGGLMNGLEVARELNCQFFTPSSISVFGTESLKDRTPQVTIQRPMTMYGVSKVAEELLCDYYYHKFELDTRGLRFPVSFDTLLHQEAGRPIMPWKCIFKRSNKRSTLHILIKVLSWI
jgi:nucleoside-diphosphate-sugar epimerase